MKHFPFRCKRHFPGFVAAMVVLAFLAIGCSETGNTPTSLDGNLLETPIFTRSHPGIQNAMAIQLANTPAFMKDPEVVGTATGLTEDGIPAVLVFLGTSRGGRKIGDSVDGVPVVKIVTGPFKALKGKPPKPPAETDPKEKQIPPIKLGCSGGWRYDLANGYCCAGTLGSLIQVGSQKRILSNYHVFEADIVPGGNGRTASNGDPIIQPGLIDVGCYASEAQNVATLVVSRSLPNHNVDCSSATIIDGMVDPTGAILGIGTISSATVDAYIGQAVKKSGRTSGVTRGTVDALNATISVMYEDECVGDVAFTKTFTGQILIVRGRKFLQGGDSGSLAVEDVDTNPRAVGLCYAGNSTYAVANPIDEVLDFFNATMVGN